MPMLADVVDAVVGGDTHRDTLALELTAPSGATIATLMIGNDERGYAEAIAWVAEHAPGPPVVVGLEGHPQLRNRTDPSVASRGIDRSGDRTSPPGPAAAGQVGSDR